MSIKKKTASTVPIWSVITDDELLKRSFEALEGYVKKFDRQVSEDSEAKTYDEGDRTFCDAIITLVPGLLNLLRGVKNKKLRRMCLEIMCLHMPPR